MSRARTPSNDNDSAIAHPALESQAVADALANNPKFVADLGAAIGAAILTPGFIHNLGAELRRNLGSLQENAVHAGLSESYFSKLIKDGLGPHVNRVSNNCVRIRFADTDRAIENLSSGKGV